MRENQGGGVKCVIKGNDILVRLGDIGNCRVRLSPLKNSLLHFSVNFCYKKRNLWPYRMLPMGVPCSRCPSMTWAFTLVTAKGTFPCMYYVPQDSNFPHDT